MTKEQILGMSFYPHDCGSMIDCVTKQDALKSMGQYAEQESIAFCQDVIDNLKVNGVHISDYFTGTVGQLYQIFKQSK